MIARLKYFSAACLFLLATLSCLFLSSCASRSKTLAKQRTIPTLMPDAGVSIIPMVNAGNLQWRVKASVNGFEGVFAVDTGAERSVLDSTFAEHAGLMAFAAPVRLIGSNQVGQVASSVPVDFFRLGALDFVDFDALVMNLFHINKVMHTPIDGILGLDILGQAQCSFDWRNNSLTLDTRAHSRPQKAIPLKVRGSRIYVDALINSKTLEFRLDTGSFSTCLTPETAARLHLPKDKIKMVMTPRIGIAEARELPQEQLTVETFLLGNINRKPVTLLVWDNTVLGMDLLEQSVLTINPKGKWMTLTESQ